MRWNDSSRLRPSVSVLVGLAGSLVALALASPSALPAKAMKPLEIQQRYSGVLQTLAAGEAEQAVEQLLEMELAAVGERQAWRYVDNLWRAKLHLIRDLLPGQDVSLLMPIILLHHDAYFRYSEMERRHLAQHSRTMAAELAGVLAERSPAATDRAFAGWILTSFASYLWSPSNIGAAADLYYRAQLIDPDNAWAQEGLAAAWERSGDYGKAIESLGRAVQLEPENRELRLRLALCHLRWDEGQQEKALAQLAELTLESSPDWVRSVAFQELARVQQSAGDEAAAEATLRAGLESLPGDQQLSLQLAAVLDGQRRRSEASRVLEAMQIGGWERQSARQTYDFWEPPDLSAVRRELRERSASGLAPLGVSLAALTAGGGG